MEAPPPYGLRFITEEIIDDAGERWAELTTRSPQTGLWPVVLEPSPEGEDRLPWEVPELEREVGRSHGIDVEAVLYEWWSEAIPLPIEDDEAFDALAPFGRTFPGLASPSDSPGYLIGAAASAHGLRGWLALVAVETPADVVAILGWEGLVNYDRAVDRLAAVLRSWEQRFGAVVAAMGLDTLTIAVRRPPTTSEQALAVAAEHFAVCPDLVWQGAGTISGYAKAIRNVGVWTFWWD